MTRILITGGQGFIGGHLVRSLLSEGVNVRLAVRAQVPDLSCDQVVVGNIDGQTEWREALMDCDHVIHLAARVHVMEEDANNPLEEYRRINAAGTKRLAEQAAAMGVKRFVYLSTIKVLGEETLKAFDAKSPAAPVCPYGQSKYEAEQALNKIAQEQGLPVVIIRPPLVYGPGVSGNVGRLLRWIQRYPCLPLGGISNHRSLVSVFNLVSLIVVCLKNPQAINQTFLVSDNHDVSTSDLVKQLALAMGKRRWLLPLPTLVLRGVGLLLNKQAEINRLLGSLQVDMNHTQRQLAWSPPVSYLESIQKTVHWHLKRGQ